MKKNYYSTLLISIISILAIILLNQCAGAVGYGTKIGKVSESVLYKGYSPEKIYNAAIKALNDVGIVLSQNKDTLTIVGQVPPFRVKATCSKSSSWITFIAVEKEKGRWVRTAASDNWTLTMDGKMIYRKGVESPDDAIEDWGDVLDRILKSSK